MHQQNPQVVDLPMDEVFGNDKFAGRTIKGYAQATSLVPQLDGDYRLPEDFARRFIVWWKVGQAAGGNDGLLVHGPTGSGKSTGLEQALARLNIPVWRIPCTPETEVEDIYGGQGLTEASTMFEPGPLYRAAKAGHVLNLEEIDRLRPTVLGALSQAMEGKPFRVPGTGELVTPHPMFRVVATANTANGRDETGHYGGSRQQNLATLSRFQSIYLGYMPKEEELALIRERTRRIKGLKHEAMLDIANSVREAFLSPTPEMPAMDTVISTRVLLRWCFLAAAFKEAGSRRPYEDGLDQALLNSASQETRAAVLELVQGRFGTPVDDPSVTPDFIVS